MANNTDQGLRIHHRQTEIELKMVDEMLWAQENRPNRLEKLQTQYDRGLITDSEFLNAVKLLPIMHDTDI